MGAGIATLAFGLSTSFAGLLGARYAYTLAVAGLSATAYSLIADCVPHQLRGRAIALVMAGYLAAGVLMYFSGSENFAFGSRPATIELPVVGSVFEWQALHLFLGLSGIAIALMALSFRDPGRRRTTWMPDTNWADARQLTFGAYVARNAWMLAALLAAGTLLSMAIFGISTWTGTYLVRTFDTAPVEVSKRLVLFAMMGPFGNVVALCLRDAVAHRRTGSASLSMILIGILASVPTLIMWPQADVLSTSIVLVSLGQFFLGFALAALLIALVDIAPSSFTARLIALQGIGWIFSYSGTLLISFAAGPGATDLQFSLRAVPPALMGLATILVLAAWRGYRRARTELSDNLVGTIDAADGRGLREAQ